MSKRISAARRDRYMAGLFARYRRITLPYFGRIAAGAKADGSAVTEADKAASRHVVASLKRHAPGQGVVSEEEALAHLPGAEWQWAVDPLDGTAAFARGLPVWGLGIGLMQGDAAREGYLCFPVVREAYAFRNGAGFLNGARIAQRWQAFAEDCRNVMITAVHGHVDVRRLHGFRLHNLGSNLYHLMALATGRCEAIITGPCQVWDLAPALPFTRARGCIERYLDGAEFTLGALMARSDFGFPVKQPLLVGPPETVDLLLRRLGG